MKVSVAEMRRSPSKLYEALERKEIVTLTRNGKDIAQIVPTFVEKDASPLLEPPAFGLWSDRKEMDDPVAYVQKLRESRYRAF